MVFGFETLIILLLVLPLHRRIVDQRPTAIQGRFDWPGVLLSALSMGLIVLALVSASTWGLIQPINPPFTVWGFSPTMPMVVVGALWPGASSAGKSTCKPMAGPRWWAWIC